jgi:hypothetical protein
MIDLDQHSDLNRGPLLKSTPTDVIISNHGPIKGYSQIGILSKFRSMADLLVRVRAYVSDVIGHRFEKVRNDHFEKWTPI